MTSVDVRPVGHGDSAMGGRDEVIHAINLEREGALGYRHQFHGTFGVALRLKFLARE
jgi:hypothetical protein